MKVLFGLQANGDARALEGIVDRIRSVEDDLTVAVLEDPDGEGSMADTEATVRDLLDGRLPGAEIRRVDGHPGSRLVEIAESEGFDRIVLGGGEQSPMGKIRIGSIAEFVLLNSHVSVTLLR
jgi:nucleotide-binding universal stress UspA family protein